jgi:RimJ/RimL family protein N-acetyltransferase
MTEILTLVTERMLLRPMSADNWGAYSALMLSSRAQYMGGPFPVSAAWGMLCADHAQWDLFGVGALMLEERQNRTCLGQVGINSKPLFFEQ